jgi:hypothetical protein
MAYGDGERDWTAQVQGNEGKSTSKAPEAKKTRNDLQQVQRKPGPITVKYPFSHCSKEKGNTTDFVHCHSMPSCFQKHCLHHTLFSIV